MSTKKKTGKLTKIELFYIENNSDKDAKEIAKDLNRSKALVEKHLDLKKDTSHVTESKSEKKTPAGELMGRKEDRGVVVMTQAASQVADETRVRKPTKENNNIHTIK